MENNQDNKGYVFVSYSSDDRDFVIGFRDYLRKEKKIDVWVDNLEISSGYWQKYIEQAINGCRVFALVTSERAFARPEEIQKEIGLFDLAYKIDKEKVLVPIRLDNSYEDLSKTQGLSYCTSGNRLESVNVFNYADNLIAAYDEFYRIIKDHVRELNYNPDFFVFEDKRKEIVKMYDGNEQSVQIPEGVKTIRSRAFMNNDILSQLDILDSVETIEDYVFSNCDSLIYVEGMKGIKNIDSNAFDGTPLVEDGKTAIVADVLLHIADDDEIINVPNGVRVIAKKAFAGKKARIINLPDSLEVIGDYAFLDCVYLEEIHMSKNLKFKGNNIFKGCFNLKNE